MNAVQYTQTLNALACAACGIAFAIPEDFQRRRREDHDSFYCPLGHPNVYTGKNDAERLRDELAAQVKRTEYIKADLERSREREQRNVRRLNATKGVVTKIKNRVSKGVCPCCNRYFSALHQHIQTQHPGYAAEVSG